MKKRLDVFLLDNDICESRNKALNVIKGGFVNVNGRVIKKASFLVDDSCLITLTNCDIWVSRGSHKLLAALDYFKEIVICDKVCVDIGSSTGGFTEVLLKNGAKKVYCVDVGHEQLHKSLRNNESVFNMEGTNAKDLTKSVFDEPIDCIVSDVSFISLYKLLPIFDEILTRGFFIGLIKPQFETEGINLMRKNKLQKEIFYQDLKSKFIKWFINNGWIVVDIIESPVVIEGCNKEFLMCATKDG